MFKQEVSACQGFYQKRLNCQSRRLVRRIEIVLGCFSPFENVTIIKSLKWRLIK